ATHIGGQVINRRRNWDCPKDQEGPTKVATHLDKIANDGCRERLSFKQSLLQFLISRRSFPDPDRELLLSQICDLTNYREGKPLAWIKEHLDCARWRIPSG